MIFADNCYLFAETRVQISKMLSDAESEEGRLGLEGGSDGLISWSLDEKVGDFKIEEGRKE